MTERVRGGRFTKQEGGSEVLPLKPGSAEKMF